MCFKRNFRELSVSEVTDTSGGMAPAIIYAAGFVLNTSPLGAVTIGVGAIATGVALAAAGKKSKNKGGKHNEK